MRKTVRGASINLTHPRSAGTQHWSNAWPTGSGKAGPVDLVRTRRRQNHVRQQGPSGAERLVGDPPQLILETSWWPFWSRPANRANVKGDGMSQGRVHANASSKQLASEPRPQRTAELWTLSAAVAASAACGASACAVICGASATLPRSTTARPQGKL
jgi:hypothetical protein